jgi:predicted amidohydrolase
MAALNDLDDRRPNMSPVNSSLRVAVAQIPIGAEIDANVGRIIRAMEECALQGAQVLVCPETAISGYSPAIGHGREPQEWPRIREGLQSIAERARELSLWVAVGSEAWEDGHWWNRFYAYNPDGHHAATYDKVHLTGDDTRYYTAGSNYPVFHIEGITVGLQICYDARFPEGYRALLHQGAEVILQGFYGAGGGTWKVPVLGAHLRSRAAESGCFIAASNVGNPLQIVVSQIVDPLGLLLAQANQDREEVLSATLQLRCVEESEIRKDYFTRFEGQALPHR